MAARFRKEVHVSLLTRKLADEREDARISLFSMPATS
jgi:hypothetical protein